MPTGEQMVPEPQGITGCRLLWEENDKLLKYLRDYPELHSTMKVKERTAWNFKVGDKGPIQGSGWWATNLGATPQSEYLVPSTCRAVGTNAYIFVEDSLWNRGRVTQSQVDSIRVAFDLRTPAFPT